MSPSTNGASMFTGFTDTDFDAYAQNKWKSNVFNRERLEVKQKLVALEREIGARLHASDGSPLLCEASVEHPALWNHKQVEAQHLFFSRNEGARKEIDRVIERSRSIQTMLADPTPQRNHIFLAVSLIHDGVEVALKLHPDARVDRQNLERKLADAWEQEQLVEILRGLPSGYLLGVTGSNMTPTQEASAERLRAALEDLARPEAPGKTRLLTVGRHFTRGELKDAGATAGALLAREIERLLPLYHWIAWTRDNDYVLMREALKQEKQVRMQRGLAAKDRVKIVRGVLAGRTGVVQEIDPRGGLRVLVGTLAVKLAADEVEKD